LLDVVIVQSMSGVGANDFATMSMLSENFMAEHVAGWSVPAMTPNMLTGAPVLKEEPYTPGDATYTCAAHLMAASSAAHLMAASSAAPTYVNALRHCFGAALGDSLTVTVYGNVVRYAGSERCARHRKVLVLIKIGRGRWRAVDHVVHRDGN